MFKIINAYQRRILSVMTNEFLTRIRVRVFNGFPRIFVSINHTLLAEIFIIVSMSGGDFKF